MDADHYRGRAKAQHQMNYHTPTPTTKNPMASYGRGTAITRTPPGLSDPLISRKPTIKKRVAMQARPTRFQFDVLPVMNVQCCTIER